MENATKALLIAGGIFLAIVILTAGVYTYTKIHNIAKAQDELSEQEQLVAFNKRYEAFNRSLIYGNDIITLMNMAYEDNHKSEGIIDIKIVAYIDGDHPTAYIYNDIEGDENYGTRELSGYEIVVTQDNIKALTSSRDKKDKDILNDFKRRVFRCNNEFTRYSGDETGNGTGRIEFMLFTEVPLNDYTHK